jgi:hypothetical protein
MTKLSCYDNVGLLIMIQIYSLKTVVLNVKGKRKKLVKVEYQVRSRSRIAVKGQCHKFFFDIRFFSSNNNTPWDPDSQAKAFLNSASNSPRYDRYLNAKIVHVVSMTPNAQKLFVR